MLKDQPSKVSRFKYGNWLFGPDKSVGLSRNRPQQVARAQEPEVNFVVAQHSSILTLSY